MDRRRTFMNAASSPCSRSSASCHGVPGDQHRPAQPALLRLHRACGVRRRRRHPDAADVRVSGVGVGKVTASRTIRPAPATPWSPCRSATPRPCPCTPTASPRCGPRPCSARSTSTSPWPSRSGGGDPVGGYLPVAETGKDVSNDEIFNAFDAPPRAQQQQVLAALDTATQGRPATSRRSSPAPAGGRQPEPVAQVYEKDQPQTDSIFVQLTRSCRRSPTSTSSSPACSATATSRSARSRRRTRRWWARCRRPATSPPSSTPR